MSSVGATRNKNPSPSSSSRTSLPLVLGFLSTLLLYELSPAKATSCKFKVPLLAGPGRTCDRSVPQKVWPHGKQKQWHSSPRFYAQRSRRCAALAEAHLAGKQPAPKWKPAAGECRPKPSWNHLLPAEVSPRPTGLIHGRRHQIAQHRVHLLECRLQLPRTARIIINTAETKIPNSSLPHEESAVGMAHGYAKIEGKPRWSSRTDVGLQHVSMASITPYCD